MAETHSALTIAAALLTVALATSSTLPRAACRTVSTLTLSLAIATAVVIAATQGHVNVSINLGDVPAATTPP